MGHFASLRRSIGRVETYHVHNTTGLGVAAFAGSLGPGDRVLGSPRRNATLISLKGPGVKISESTETEPYAAQNDECILRASDSVLSRPAPVDRHFHLAIPLR